MWLATGDYMKKRIVSAVLWSIAAWFLGLVLDANIDFGPYLCLRILFPVLVMGSFILYSIGTEKR